MVGSFAVSDPLFRIIEHDITEESIQLFDRELGEQLRTESSPQLERLPGAVAPGADDAADRFRRILEQMRSSGMLTPVVSIGNTASQLDAAGQLDETLFGRDLGITFGFAEQTDLDEVTVAAGAAEPVAIEENEVGNPALAAAPGNIVHEYENIEFDEQVAAALKVANENEFALGKELGAEITDVTKNRLSTETNFDDFDATNQLLIEHFRQHMIQGEAAPAP